MSEDDTVPIEEMDDEIKKILLRPEAFKVAYEEIASKTRGSIERLASASRALLIAHGAAVVASLQIISQNQNAKLANANVFCAVFCYGFILSMFSNFFSYYALEEVNTRHWEKKTEGAFRTYLWLTAGPMIISFVLLFVAVVAIGHDLYRW
ncbi:MULTISPECIES: hypothetical protein [unclassified Mesorhizobium]|uniref:hypothetical protein n=1 Tax=unclassified Mesorhizobium TaxID=325217 RepID=UPI000F75E8B8|nr:MULTISPECIES: hypothetical protein [unclassified Mesorhizobium]AZO54847.1 hypothetical protein EJ077_16375 [Mesorhizobium sp. M8A.F.Ca.ET.057.01.1.1]RWE44170.1 MAG: hypothetical protein EOS80_19685 [Mesorhizobium sp.]